jgi:GT2 family glycosyltransferase
MHVAKYDTLLWCDDDNWLSDIYVQTAFDIMNNNSTIGALGGWCEAAFETEKPQWFNIYGRYFAVSKQGKRSGDITRKKGCVYGAGMVLRKSHWLQLQSLGFKHLLKDRVGASLSSGGDTEYCYALRLLGYKMWYDERLYFKHFMSQGRLSLNYVSRMRKAMAYSNFMLWPYLDLLNEKPQTRLDFIKSALKGFPVLPIKKTGALLIGNYEQKEVAKRYLRNLRYKLFYYSKYKQNMFVLKSWKP